SGRGEDRERNQRARRKEREQLPAAAKRVRHLGSLRCVRAPCRPPRTRLPHLTLLTLTRALAECQTVPLTTSRSPGRTLLERRPWGARLQPWPRSASPLLAVIQNRRCEA